MLANGDLVAGGTFWAAGGVAAKHVARWNGQNWFGFGSGMSHPVHALAALPNGDVVATGDFTTAGGVAANHLARWNGTGWQAEVVDPTMTYTAGCALSFAADGTAYIAYGADYTDTRSARRNPTTGLWTV